ncbi:MAG: transcriptional repressor, partial [Elainellaceae cyanobacterium]
REHLSARQIYDRLTQQGKDIGHTSVYQNLEALSSQNVIECVDRADGRLYGSVSDSHSHVNCLDTAQLLDVFVQLPDELIQQVEQQLGITITDYRVDFFAYAQGQGKHKGQSQDKDQPQTSAAPPPEGYHHG